ncbi:MAG: MFS transporter, partial [Chloroflexota bacterium]
LGVTMATAVFGGLTPFLAELFIRMTGWTALPGAMIAVVALAVMPVLLTMPETQPRLVRTRARKRTAIEGSDI